MTKKLETLNKTIKPMNELIDIDWIDVDPPQGEIQGDPGKEYIPIGLIEIKLKKYDPNWGSEKFWFQYQQHSHDAGGLAHGSIEVVTHHWRPDGYFERRLTGACSLVVPPDIVWTDPNINANLAATVKSECIKNAVKAIGKAFGAGLNDRDVISIRDVETPRTGRKRPDPQPMKPDKKAQADFNRACENQDDKAIKGLLAIYPSIRYTGTSETLHKRYLNLLNP